MKISEKSKGMYVCLAGMIFNTLISSTSLLQAADWPQWRGENRQGVWNETGIVERFTSAQIPVLWRAEISGGNLGIITACISVK